MLLGKTVFRIRQKGVPPLLLPTSMLQLPRCLARICNFFHKNNPIAIWQVLKLAIAAGKTNCKIQFASQTWATRPHLGSIFEKLLHRKTFWFVQRLSENHAIRKNGFPHLAKGGFHPCFCLPACCNCPVALPEFVTSFIKIIQLRFASFKTCNCSWKNKLQNSICFANVGYSPTPRQHF